MHLIDDIHLILSFRRTNKQPHPRISRILSTPLLDAASISITFMDSRRLRSPCTSCRSPHGLPSYRMLAVYGFCKDFCNRCFTGTARSAKQIGMSDSVRFYLILQCCYNMLLPFDILQILSGRNFRYSA